MDCIYVIFLYVPVYFYLPDVGFSQEPKYAASNKLI